MMRRCDEIACSPNGDSLACSPMGILLHALQRGFSYNLVAASDKHTLQDWIQSSAPRLGGYLFGMCERFSGARIFRWPPPAPRIRGQSIRHCGNHSVRPGYLVRPVSGGCQLQPPVNGAEPPSLVRRQNHQGKKAVDGPVADVFANGAVRKVWDR